MDIGAVNGIRAAIAAAADQQSDLERRPVLAARVGPVPMSAFARGPAQDEMLRAALRGRAALLDLDPVLARPVAEEPGQSGAPAAVQAAMLREPEEAKAKRDASSQTDAEEPVDEASALGASGARGHFSQSGAVDAESDAELVARFSDEADRRDPQPE